MQVLAFFDPSDVHGNAARQESSLIYSRILLFCSLAPNQAPQQAAVSHAYV